MTHSDLVKQTKKLITIPSTADNPQALGQALEVIAEQLRATPGITVERFERSGKPSLLAYAGKVRPKTFKILLNGHVDVVPGKPEQFEPQVRGNRLYGRGTLDMKAAALVLADVFCELAPNLDYPLGLQIVTDEEIGGHNGTAYQLEQGVTAEFVLCGEFSDAGTICCQSRGICQAQLRFTGKTAHSAYLWNGDNALLAAQQAIAKLLRRYPIPKQFAWVTTANVATIATTNAVFNQVPGQATVDLDIRYVPHDRDFASAAAARKFLQRLAPKAKVELSMFEPAHLADPKHPLSKKLAAALAATTGQAVHFVQKPGAADARFFSARNIPAVIMGLQGESLHGDDEYILLDSIDEYRRTLAKFLVLAQKPKDLTVDELSNGAYNPSNAM